MQPIKLVPAFKDYLWGGTKLKDDYKMNCELERVAEAWVLSCHKDGESLVESGEYKGKTLSELIDILGDECLGNRGRNFAFFPILIKLIDAKNPLSIQVHPSDEYALEHENEFGKTEMWYIVDCDEGAFLYYGFKEKITPDEFSARIEDGTICDVLNKVPVKKGDCFFISSGTIHAIGAGILIAEIQQNSNCTYRVYDYKRVGADGKPRPLHIEKAKKVAKLCPPTEKYGAVSDGKLAECEYFTVKKHTLSGSKDFHIDGESFMSVLCTSGECEADGVKIKAGECVFIPAYYGNLKVTGNAELLESRV